jgi:hypothetical protein
MREEKVQPMYSSNNYKLECESISNVKKFETFHNISLILKILAMLCLLVIIWKIWFLWISLGLFIISSIVSNYALSLVFSYEYWLDNGVLKVTKYLKNNTSKILVTMKVDSQFECDIIPYVEIDFNDKNCYIDKAFDGELYLKLKTDDKQFYIIADKYFYSLLMEKK